MVKLLEYIILIVIIGVSVGTVIANLTFGRLYEVKSKRSASNARMPQMPTKSNQQTRE